MKIAVSNIAWPHDQLESHLGLLRELECEGIELAPSIVWPEPVSSSAAERRRTRRLIERHGLRVVGLHSLFFNHPEMQLFGSDQERCSYQDYLAELAVLCRDLGGDILVNGSPRNRILCGKEMAGCFRMAKEVFTTTAERLSKIGVALCIEPLADCETEFVSSVLEGAKLVEAVGHPNFLLHLDVKSVLGNCELPKSWPPQTASMLRHVHVGDPGLHAPGSTGVDHRLIAEYLRAAKYGHFLSIEMRRSEPYAQDTLLGAIDFVKSTYGAGDAVESNLGCRRGQ